MKKYINCTIILCLFSLLSLQAQTTEQKIHTFLNHLAGQGFNGAVLVEQQGTVLCAEGYGLADKENNIQNKPSTIFDIGSITKQFTAAAILKLEMQGKLKVDDLLSRYIDGVPTDKASITLHHLLTHSSGLVPGLGDDYQKISTSEFTRKALQSELLFHPGAQYEYSNAGYTLLAIIIEKVTDQSYETYLYQNLLKPAGMEQTGYLRPDFDSNHIAVGYRNGERWGKPNEKTWSKDGPYWHLKGNGGILSSIEDMYKWHQALLSDNILSAAAKQKYYYPHVAEDEEGSSHYGYGWAIFPTPRNTNLVAHNGGNGIFFADFWRYFDEEITIIVMTNSAAREAEVLAMQLARIILTPDYNPLASMSRDNIVQEEYSKEIEKFALHVYERLWETNNGDWDTFLTSQCTKEFKNMVPMKTHISYLSGMHKKINGSEIETIKVHQDEVELGLNQEGEEFILVIQVVQNDTGEFKVAGLMLDH